MKLQSISSFAMWDWLHDIQDEELPDWICQRPRQRGDLAAVGWLT